jgi:hypothetical protein
MEDTKTEQDIMDALAAEIPYQWRVKTFHKQGVREKLKAGSLPEGTRGQFLAYIDARDVYVRLDAVLGIGNWKDDFVHLGNNVVKTTLTVTIDGHEKTVSDVGYPNSDQDDEPLKSAVSDGIKRAAVHLGVGRFLYSLDPLWVEVDTWGKPLKPITLGAAPANSAPTTKSAPQQTNTSTTQPSTKPAIPTESTSHQLPNGDWSCEIPGCTGSVWASKVEKTRQYHDGHVICYYHSKNGDWRQMLAAKPSSAPAVDSSTGEYLDGMTPEEREMNAAADAAFPDAPTYRTNPDGSVQPIDDDMADLMETAQ